MADWKELLTFIDRYDLLARVLPAVVLCLPAVLPWWMLLGAAIPLWLVAVFGVPLLFGLSMIVAGLGRRYQARLWARQGGAPSTRLCRWGDAHIEKCRKEQMHAAVATHFGIELHSPRKEPHNRPEADRLIGAAFARVRELLRKRDPNGLWFRHLIEYGFARNVLAVMGWSAAGWLASAVMCGILWAAGNDRLALAGMVLGLVLAAMFCVVRFHFRDAAASHLGERYALTAWHAFLSLEPSAGAVSPPGPSAPTAP